MSGGQFSGRWSFARHELVSFIQMCKALPIVCVACALAQQLTAGPFAVDARLETSNGRSVLELQVLIPPSHMIYADGLRVEVSPPARLVPRSFPEAEEHVDPLNGETSRVFSTSFTALYTVENQPAGPLEVTVRLQGCSENVCFLPSSETFLLENSRASPGPPGAVSGTERVAAFIEPAAADDWRVLTNGFERLGQRVGYMRPSELISFLEEAGGEAGAVPGGPLEYWMKGSLLLSILAILAGGLALNLTPCVLPLIPVNLAIIGSGVVGQTRFRGAVMGSLYGLGIAVTYGALGLLAAVAGFKFGAINASPWFNIGVAALFAVLALAMFDVYMIDFSRFQARFAGIGKAGGFLVIAGMGALAALLAGSCVAPVVLSVVLLSATLFAEGRAIG